MCPDGTTGAATGGNVHMLQFDNIGINNENEEATVSNFTFTQNDVLLLVHSYPVKLGIVGLSTHRLSVSKLTLPIKHGAAMDI